MFSYNILNTLSNFSRFDYTIGWMTIWRYLKALGYFCLKARRKPFVSNELKAARLNGPRIIKYRSLIIGYILYERMKPSLRRVLTHVHAILHAAKVR